MIKSIVTEYGIGINRAQQIGQKIGINSRKGLTINLSKKHIIKVENAKASFNYIVNDALKNSLIRTYTFLSNDIKSRKGLRNKNGLPSRGQKTRTNAKTKKKLRGVNIIKDTP